MQVKLVLTIETKDNKPFVPHDVLKDVLKDVVKDVVKGFEIELSERQILILEMIHQNSTISAKTMSEKLSEKKPVDERTVQRDLAILQKNGILSREGGRKNGEWIIHTKKE